MFHLDIAATSWPKPPGVAAANTQSLYGGGGNPGRSAHPLAMRAAENVMKCRDRLSELFNISNPLQVCFTADATESLNLAINGVLRPGDHVVCSRMEHNSVWRPLCRLQSIGVEFNCYSGLDRSAALELKHPETGLYCCGKRSKHRKAPGRRHLS